MTTYTLAVLVLSLVRAPVGADPEPCKLLTAAEITSALGSAPGEGTALGPEVDEEHKATNWSCARTVGSYFLEVDVFEFPSAGAATQELAKIRELAQDGNPFVLHAVAGERDPSLWGSSEEGAIWAIARGKYILVVTLAGNLARPATLRDPMKRLAVAAMGRL
jgi:hypothetical protein